MQRNYWAYCTCAAMLLACGYEVEPHASAAVDGEAVATQALIPADGNINDFPPWLRPYIRPTSIFSQFLHGNLEFKTARQALDAAVEECACAIGASAAKPDAVLSQVDTLFDLQYTAALRASVTEQRS